MKRLSGAMLCALAMVAATTAGSACGTKDNLVFFKKQGRVPQIGDRLLVEILDEKGEIACSDCAREIPASAEGVWPVSIGVAPSESKGRVRIRARLYRSLGGDPKVSHEIIDVTARLPDPYVGAYEMLLPTRCFGRAPDVAKGETCLINEFSNRLDYGPEPELQELGRNKLLSLHVPCEHEPKPEMTCVPGDVFIMGDVRLDAIAFDYPSKPEHAEWAVFPVHMDLDEVTVGTVRKLVRNGKLKPLGSTRRGLLAKGAGNEACTYLGPDDASNDALPINCIGQLLADDVCTAVGKRLPYEYEWELAAGNGQEETRYPWGEVEGERAKFQINEDPRIICDRAVVGRGHAAAAGESTRCIDLDRTRPVGPVAGGSALDVTASGIRNMGGNVAEWVGDRFSLYGEGCGTPCSDSSKILAGEPIPYRGGSWARSPDAAVGVARFAREDGTPTPHVGFRCALDENDIEKGSP